MSNTTSPNNVETQDPPSDSDDVFGLQLVLINIAITCFCFGSFLILAIIAVRTLLKKGLASGSRRWLCAAVIIFLVSSTVQCVMNLTYEIANVGRAFGGYNVGKLMIKLGHVHTVFGNITFLLNDALVVWRAWVLSDRRLPQVMLAAFMILTIGGTAAELALIFRGSGQPASLDDNTLPISLIFEIPLIANNCFATGVIMYKLWIYRTEIKKDLQQNSQKSQVESVLFLLVESGFIYLGWWLFYLIIIYVPSVPAAMRTICGAPGYIAPAIYPLLIILIVEHQKAKAERPPRTPLTILQFNPPTPQSPSHQDSSDRQFISIIQSIVDIQSVNNRDGAQSKDQTGSSWRHSVTQSTAHTRSRSSHKPSHKKQEEEEAPELSPTATHSTI